MTASELLDDQWFSTDSSKLQNLKSKQKHDEIKRLFKARILAKVPIKLKREINS